MSRARFACSVSALCVLIYLLMLFRLVSVDLPSLRQSFLGYLLFFAVGAFPYAANILLVKMYPSSSAFFVGSLITSFGIVLVVPCFEGMRAEALFVQKGGKICGVPGNLLFIFLPMLVPYLQLVIIGIAALMANREPGPDLAVARQAVELANDTST